ncbi:MAG TPA: hypothetical protein VFX30_02045 [bacterium]|nr:hypothetical protein [bacterium]
MSRVSLVIVSVSVLLGLVSSAGAACPEGNYAVKGWNPGVPTSGKESYTGTITIKTLGEVCQLDWKIGSQIFGGLATYDAAAKMLYSSYADLKAGWFGIVYYKDGGATMNGQWAVYNDKSGKLGTEILTKQ